MLRSGVLAIVLTVGSAGCAGSRPAPKAEARTAPLTSAEAEAAIAAQRDRFAACYGRTRLRYGLLAPSSYVLRLTIPASRDPALATVQSATEEGQEDLEACLIEVLETTAFPSAPESPLVLDVPIRAPRR